MDVEDQPLTKFSWTETPVNRAGSWLSALPTTRFLLALFLLNLLLRTLITLPAQPDAAPHDGYHYMLLARSLARGEGYRNRVLYAPRFNRIRPHRDRFPFPDFQRPPLYPALMAGAHHLFGESYFVARMVNVVLASLLPLLAYFLALRVCNRREVAILAAVLMTLHGPLLEYTSETMLEVPFTVCVCLFLLAFLKGTRETSLPWLLASGVLWGVCWYARHEAIYVLAVPVAIECLAQLGWRRGVPAFAMMAALAILTVAPWHYRAYALTGAWFHSELKLHLFAAYADYHRFFSELTPVPQESIYTHLVAPDPPAFLERYVVMLFRLTCKLPVEVAGGALQFFLALYAWWIHRGEWRKHAFFIIWIGANVGFFALTFTLARFLYVLIPALTVYAALGIHEALARVRPDGRLFTFGALRALVMMMLLTAAPQLAESESMRDRSFEWLGQDIHDYDPVLGHIPWAVLLLACLGLLAWWLRRGGFDTLTRRALIGLLALSIGGHAIRGAYMGVHEHMERSSPELIEWMDAGTAPDATLMVYRKPYRFAWLLDRNVIQLPLPPARQRKGKADSVRQLAEYRRELARLVDVFGVNWIVIKGKQKGDRRPYFGHYWPPSQNPLPQAEHVQRLTTINGRKRTLYDLYRIEP